MKNNWKYSTLSSAEKLKRIENGDSDLYKTEMDGVNKYISLLSEVGADDGEAVSYKNKLTAASKNAAGNAAEKSDAVFPKYAGGKNYRLINSAYESLMEKMASYYEKLSALEEERETVNGYLSEWLANNGYSRDGNMAKNTLDVKNEEFDMREKELNESHEKSVKTPKRILGLDPHGRL